MLKSDSNNNSGSNNNGTMTNMATSSSTFSSWVYPQTTTGYFINITGTTVYIWANAGTVTATGFAGTPTIYVDGQVSSVISAGKWQYVTVFFSIVSTMSIKIFTKFKRIHLLKLCNEV